MIYYTPPINEAIKDRISAWHLGCITTPDQGNIVFYDEWDMIADNGCFSGKWTHDKWFNWLIAMPRQVRFATAPDVFDPDGGACHAPTVERWNYYAPIMRRHGFTPAFVCQVGATYGTIPDDAEVLFLGGTTEWKLGEVAEAITRRAVVDGRWVHCGRVNSLKRMRLMDSWGVSSCDGTFLKYGPDKNLPQLLRWLDQINGTSHA